MRERFMGTAKQRSLAVFGLAALAMCFGGVMGFLQTSEETTGRFREGMLGYMLPFAVLLAVLSYAVGAWWMKSVDEAAQEAHKWSWYWGGSAGMAVGAGLYLLSFLPEAKQWTIPSLSGDHDPLSYFVTGGVFVTLLLVIGYLIAWAGWWLKRR